MNEQPTMTVFNSRISIVSAPLNSKAIISLPRKPIPTEEFSPCSGTLALTADTSKRDQTIESQARQILRASAYISMQNVSCRIELQVLFLDGSVSSYFLKQMAQTVLRELVRDGLTLVNRISVEPYENKTEFSSLGF